MSDEKIKELDAKDEVDGSRVVDKLTLEIGGLVQQVAILKIKNEDLQTLNDDLKTVVKKQKKVIEAYEKKENVKADNLTDDAFDKIADEVTKKQKQDELNRMRARG